ncbi:MAG: PatB family C-S lyase [Lachnospiraceae bacterium]
MSNFDHIINRVGYNSKKWDACEETFGDKEIIPMWIADMDFRVPEKVTEAIEERAAHGIFGYTGMPDSYLEAVQGWMKKHHGWAIEKEWICHSPGVVSALSFLIDAFTEPGDKVIVQSPVYYPFARSVRTSGRTLLDNPLIMKDGRYQMDLESLEAQLDDSVKMILLCSPHNPVGRVWSREELEALAKLCLEHHILIVSDEVHADLLFEGSKHTCFPTLSPEVEQNTILCTGASKTFNLAGLKTSSIIIPDPELREKFKTVLNRYNVGSGNIFGLVATETAYRYGEEWLEELKKYLQGNLEYMISFMERELPEIPVTRPEGTYLVWMDFRSLGMCDSELEDFCRKKAKIAFDPGYEFGTGGSGYMRANIACPRKTLETALENLKKAIRERES